MKRLLILAAFALSACGQSETAPPQQAVAAENWTNPGGDSGKTHHSALTDISPANIGRLGLAWQADLGTNRVLEATPVVVDGIMYVPAGSRVIALDADSGVEKWSYAIPPAPAQASQQHHAGGGHTSLTSM